VDVSNLCFGYDWRATRILPFACALMVTNAALGETASPAQTAAGQAAALEEITVTAQRREQNLQSVPISITAFTEDMLAANRVADVLDLSAIAPNLTVRSGPGGSNLPSFSIRGLVSRGTAPGQDKGISLYLDGVYLQNVIGAISDLADIERIEVLKGPQGTLFGRNATGGAISFTTHDPSGKFSARQEFTAGNYNQFRSKSHVDLPAWGPLSASFSYVHSERRGDVRNLGAGTTWDFTQADPSMGIRTSPKYLGDQDIDAGFGAFKLDAGDNLTFVLKLDYEQNHYSPDAQGLAGIDLSQLPGVGPLLGAQFALQPNPSNLTQVSKYRPNAVNNAFSTENFTSNFGQNLTARYAVNDAISIKNILSFRQNHAKATDQLDALGGLTNQLGLIGPVGAPFLVIGTADLVNENQWSDETQVNFDSHWVSATAGFIHFHDKIDIEPFGGSTGLLAFVTAPNFTIPASFRLPTTTVAEASDAVYVQPEIHLREDLDLIVGARVTHDHKSGTDNASPAAGPAPIDYKKTTPTYLAGLDYKPADNALLYVKYSTGFVSGGSLGTLAYNPETAKSYEAGTKLDLLGRKLRTNFAVFHVDYDDLQYNTRGLNLNLPLIGQVILNAGHARANGFELETTYLPIEGLTLIGNLGYLDFKFTSISPLLGNLSYFLPNERPKWTGNAAVQYAVPGSVAGGALTLRVDTNYQSKTYYANTPTTPQLIANTVSNNTLLLNARVALAKLRFAGLATEIALWGRNLTDNRNFTDVDQGDFFFAGRYQRARTYGIDVNFAF
jgi:iron complex outermembrane receptor protein